MKYLESEWLHCITKDGLYYWASLKVVFTDGLHRLLRVFIDGLHRLLYCITDDGVDYWASLMVGFFLLLRVTVEKSLFILL
ncbi:hypothetical protein U1Q18_014221 [Sarracenia purpurea var. burkii]